MTVIIGRGEETLVKILKDKIPNCEIFIQVPLATFVPHEERILFSDRQKKETIDIMIIYKTKKYACRVQDSRHQKGQVLMQVDKVQKNLICKYNGKNSVIDFRESECPVLFSEKNNWYSQSEVGLQFELSAFPHNH